ncbi:hypothetical protein BDZ89DRAFT_1145073 [Hymenopellis radicata]|nr:hypothetical protein BDZ89DRAFT_1145073 [Hymenopellis radicata]
MANALLFWTPLKTRRNTLSAHLTETRSLETSSANSVNSSPSYNHHDGSPLLNSHLLPALAAAAAYPPSISLPFSTSKTGVSVRRQLEKIDMPSFLGCRSLRAHHWVKKLLVETLKELGEVVGITDDGTNDGPALKTANVGFSVGIAGTEVAKEASESV